MNTHPNTEFNDLAQRVEELEAKLEAVQSKNFDLRTRNATLARMMRDYYGALKADASRGTDELVGLRGCNSRHGVRRAVEPCIYRMRTTDPGCTGCVERDEDQPAEAGQGVEND